MKKLMNLFKSETVRYLIFGVLATAVYAFVKWLTWQAWHSGWGSETAAQASSIIFAFFTNKLFVFKHELFFYSYPSLLTGGSLINILIF